MALRVRVVGCGALAAAAALSLLAGGAAEARAVLLARDADDLDELRRGAGAFCARGKPVAAAPRLSFRRVSDDDAEDADAALLCVPVAALADEAVLQCARRCAGLPLFVFTRGLMPDGQTPLQKLREVMEAEKAMKTAESAAKPAAAGLIAVSGPLFAKEWAAAATVEKPGENSGVSLSIAAVDKTNEINALALAQRMWPREAVELVDTPAAAEVMALANACAPLCAMGAGMVSSEYPANISAAMSFLQHALTATQKLVCNVLALDAATPLPAGVTSMLAMACTSQASREFVFGRKLNFYFKHKDAIRAVYPGGSHESLNMTVEGLHTLLTAKGVVSPFYEVLMDAFLTVLRASVAGRGLVRSGDYEYRQVNPKDSPLLRHVLEVDEAMLSGDEKQFEDAKKKLEAAFSTDANPPQTSSFSSTP